MVISSRQMNMRRSITLNFAIETDFVFPRICQGDFLEESKVNLRHNCLIDACTHVLSERIAAHVKSLWRGTTAVPRHLNPAKSLCGTTSCTDIDGDKLLIQFAHNARPGAGFRSDEVVALFLVVWSNQTIRPTPDIRFYIPVRFRRHLVFPSGPDTEPSKPLSSRNVEEAVSPTDCTA